MKAVTVRSVGVAFAGSRETPCPYVGRPRRHGFGGQGLKLGVATYETRRSGTAQPDDVVEHEDLSVAGSAGANAEGGHRYRTGDLSRQGIRHAFDDEREATRGAYGYGVLDQELCFSGGAALYSVASHGMEGLRGQAYVAHDRDLCVKYRPYDLQTLGPAFQLDGPSPSAHQADGVVDRFSGPGVVARPGKVRDY